MEEPAPAGGSRTPTPTQGPGISGINDRESRPVDQGSECMSSCAAACALARCFVGGSVQSSTATRAATARNPT